MVLGVRVILVCPEASIRAASGRQAYSTVDRRLGSRVGVFRGSYSISPELPSACLASMSRSRCSEASPWS